MAKKQPERSELEALRAENKKLRSALKRLHKQAGRGDKAKAHFEELEAELTEQFLEEEVAEKYVQVSNKAFCTNCGKDELEEISLGVKTLIICKNCRQRTTRR